MSVYVITGGTTGIGSETKTKLLAQGHEVFNIDYNGGDFTADLGSEQGRESAIQAVYEKYPDGIDALICCAGVGTGAPAQKIFAINFYGARAMAKGLRDLLKKKAGNCVLIASNTIEWKIARQDWVALLLSDSEEEVCLEYVKDVPSQMGQVAYTASKLALVKWARRSCADWAADGLRLNIVAPGNTSTPLIGNLTPEQKQMALMIPIPTRYNEQKFLNPKQIADCIIFLASEQANAVNGAVLYVDGGTDALLRSE